MIPVIEKERASPRILDRAVMVFCGEYDIACKEHLRLDLARLNDIRDVVLDFTDVTYIDSTLIGELIRLHQIREDKGYGPMAIVVQKPQLKRLFALLSLENVFRFTDKLGNAIPQSQPATALEYASVGTRASCNRHERFVHDS